MGRLEHLDAITLDVYGTLVRLDDPVPRLVEVLREQGVGRDPEQVNAGFEAEMAYYGPHSHEGRDAASLADLNERCAKVFLDAVGAELPPSEFAPLYVGALEFELLPAVLDAVRAFRSFGLELAAVTNWDVTVHEQLARLGLSPYLSDVVTAAETGARKPDATVFRRALELLRVEPARTLHVGDHEADREGAVAAGLQFAHAPLPRVLEELA